MMQKSKILFASACLLLLGSNTVSADVTVVNNLNDNSGCPGGNTLTLFVDGGQQNVPPGESATLAGDFSGMPGIGIQVNNWYWTATEHPVQAEQPQNPDNSGGQFTIDGDCNLNRDKPWFGEGIPTWLIADVSAEQSEGGCRITVSGNGYTEAVTPGCCSPPGIGENTCAGPFGETNNGQSWPPAE